MRIGLFVVALVLAASTWTMPARAATEAITISAPTTKFNIANCKDETFDFTVTFTNVNQYYDQPTFPSGSSYEIFLSRGSGCSPSDGEDPGSLTEVACKVDPEKCCEQLDSGEVAIDTVTGMDEVGVGPLDIAEFFDCDAGTEGSFELVVFAQEQTGSSSSGYQTDWKKDSISVKFDFVRPSPPQLTDVEPASTRIDVKWTPLGDDTLRYRAYAADDTFDTRRAIDDQRGELTDLHWSRITDAGDGSASISGLRTLTEYQVVVVSIDDQDNESLPSDPLSVSTVEVTDLYEYYRNLGGSETGGYCATVAAGTGWRSTGSLLLLLLPALFWSRRKGGPRQRRSGPRARARGGAGACAALLGAALLGLLPGLAPLRSARAESPRILTFSLSMGTYRPLMDEEFHSSAGTGPYKRYFGEDGLFMPRIDLGWNLFTSFGTLSAGIGFGYGSVTGDAFIEGGDQRAPEETKLRLIPLSASLTYALDIFAQRFSFPLVPFASGGADYVLWSIYDGAGNVASTPDGEGSGGIPGYHYSFGVRLLLDVFAQDMATSFDHDMGVNNSYLFFEYLVTRIDRFGDGKSMVLSANTPFFGIAFDF